MVIEELADEVRAERKKPNPSIRTFEILMKKKEPMEDGFTDIMTKKTDNGGNPKDGQWSPCKDRSLKSIPESVALLKSNR